jgi:hypothetical protein
MSSLDANLVDECGLSISVDSLSDEYPDPLRDDIFGWGDIIVFTPVSSLD